MFFNSMTFFFRCDCGNSSFPKENPCKLEPNKADKNEDNK